MDRIAGIDSLAAQVKVGLSSYRFLSPQGLLKPDRLCAKQQRSNTTFSSRGGPKRVALGANQVSSLSFFNQ